MARRENWSNRKECPGEPESPKESGGDKGAEQQGVATALLADIRRVLQDVVKSLGFGVAFWMYVSSASQALRPLLSFLNRQNSGTDCLEQCFSTFLMLRPLNRVLVVTPNHEMISVVAS